MDELNLRKAALVPNSKQAKCPLCEEKMYPNTVSHHCGTVAGECRVDQIRCVHCGEMVILINHQILNPVLEKTEGRFCICYNHPQYKETWISELNLKKFQGDQNEDEQTKAPDNAST